MTNHWKLQLGQLRKEIESLYARELGKEPQLEIFKNIDGRIEIDLLERNIEKFLENNRNFDDKVVCATLKSMRNSISNSRITDEYFHRQIRKLWACCRHPFPNTRESAKNFEKKFTKVQKLLDQEIKRTNYIPLLDNWKLDEIKSIGRLIEVSKSLNICTRHYELARAYMDKVVADKYRIWVIRNPDTPIYQLKIDLDSNVIDEFSGDRKILENTGISHELAMAILRKLDTNGDAILEFVQAGALSRFKNGRPDITPFAIGGKEIWLWRYTNELILAVDEDHDGRLYWSRFELPLRILPIGDDSYRWQNHWSLEKLLNLTLQNPELFEQLRNVNC